MASASKASKNVATPMMIRVRTCHHEIGIRSIRATTSSIEPPPGAMLSLALIVPSPSFFFPLPLVGRGRGGEVRWRANVNASALPPDPPPCPPPQGGGRRSNKLHGNSAELAEISVQRIAFARMDHAGERAGEHDVAGLQRDAVLAELVGEPGDAERRMTEHAGGDAGLLDLGIAVHDAADPAQVDVHRPDRPDADHDAGGGALVRYGVEYLARSLQPRIDDFERRHDIFGGAQHVGQADAGALERLAHDEGELDLDAGQAEILMPDAGAVGGPHM